MECRSSKLLSSHAGFHLCIFGESEAKFVFRFASDSHAFGFTTSDLAVFHFLEHVLNMFLGHSCNSRLSHQDVSEVSRKDFIEDNFFVASHLASDEIPTSSQQP